MGPHPAQTPLCISTNLILFRAQWNTHLHGVAQLQGQVLYIGNPQDASQVVQCYLL